jgi:hypothetical protein
LCDSHGDGQQLRELESCKHIFHRDCIDQWFLGTPLFSLKCPLCREPVVIEPSRDATASIAWPQSDATAARRD